MRVVSLVPSVTETLLAWGVPPVAVTRFCEVEGYPTVGGTKNPDVGAIVDLAPDLVVLCDEENRSEDAEALAAAGVPLHVVSIRAVVEVAPALEALAARLGVTPPPVEPPGVVVRGRARRAFVPIWRRPWMTLNGDTYGSSVLASIGVANVFADEAERYPTVSLEEAASRTPDMVVAPSEPYPFGARHVAELEVVAPVVLVDGRDLFWWGARTPAALGRLARCLSA
jgi:ABC-type Fe3+-hydroxamate transport system substrate-binding protein